MTTLKEIRNGQKQQDSRLARIESNCGSTFVPTPETFDIPLPIKAIEQFDLLEESLKNQESRNKFVII